MTLARKAPLRPPKAPNLLVAPVDYRQQYIDQLNNALRLYFNQIDNGMASLLSPYGGGLLEFPFIEASYTNFQYATATNTATIVLWDTTTFGNYFTLNPSYTATAEIAGIYKITYSLQFANNDNAAHDAIVWLRINGSTSTADLANSTTIFTVGARKSAGVPTYVAGYSEIVFSLNAGDELGLWWGTTQAASSGGATGIYMYSQAAQTTPMAYPATPSAIGSITFVSALY
jgi:hypothetical protein